MSSTPKSSLDSEERASNASERSSQHSRISSTADSPRRKSIQFNIAGPSHRVSTVDLRAPSAGAGHNKKRRTKNRRPLGEVLRPRHLGVSFNTFDNPDAADFSLTLNYKHKGYQSTRRSRTFLCGTDQNDYSDFALEWLIDELVDDGDEIVCLRAVEKDSTIASDAAIEEGKYRQEAEKLFEQVIQKNSQDEKAISLVLELAVGKIQDIIQRMIRIYEPSVLIVGTRGRNLGGVQGLLPGSVSKYCLQQSPIPVIVKKKKRLADPTRRSYNQILELSEQRGSKLFDAGSSTDSHVSRLPDEEAAVAAALGLPQSYANSRSSLSMSERSSVSHDENDSPSPNSGSLATTHSPAAGSPESTESESTTESTTDDEPVPQAKTPPERSSSETVSTEESKTVDAASTDESELASSTQSTPRPGSSKLNIPVIVTEDMTEKGSNGQ
ncbi:universal stress protein family domain protein [Aspergillus nomiae NRRL 13137]|uniref:Universal stress protein family domain protein n=1 Tax=Aspergillus nomiae NRRL (strain ATCC 15546 / NRRL 13137 / CBS 260.88 / M93) TaxID=1509407 RepID=A0A0L1J4B9_ASPN3|nr:universal stress protein family domain protein [Aspergillus nomiae NRRL 13137]KNG86656.1 universal stress protein family domain protein [Aspergillus nomiae NRRL 13137]